MMFIHALNSILLVSIILLGLVLVAAEDSAKSCAMRCVNRSL